MNRTDYNREWRHKNPEKTKLYQEKSRKWATKHRKHLREYAAKWRIKHGIFPKPKYTPEEKRLMRNARSRSHYHKSKSNGRMYRAVLLRRARKRQATVEDCTEKIRQLKNAKFCHWCCVRLELNNFSIDHVIPLARGGAHKPDNLVAACRSCNLSKNDKLLHEWRSQLAA